MQALASRRSGTKQGFVILPVWPGTKPGVVRLRSSLIVSLIPSNSAIRDLLNCLVQSKRKGVQYSNSVHLWNVKIWKDLKCIQKKRVCYIHDVLLRGHFHRVLESEGTKEIVKCSRAVLATSWYWKLVIAHVLIPLASYENVFVLYLESKFNWASGIFICLIWQVYHRASPKHQQHHPAEKLTVKVTVKKPILECLNIFRKETPESFF